MAGSAPNKPIKSRRDDRTLHSGLRLFRPCRDFPLKVEIYPAMNGWAIFDKTKKKAGGPQGQLF